ncbi:MAG: 6-phosphogluconolactonase [Gammaproteobacteria bacterium]|nr:6-phosphogluconolactonase [Gammaproteobacteria bacterium]
MKRADSRVLPDLHRYDDSETLLSALTDHIQGSLQAAVDARGQASLIVSGGRTPLPLFARLHELPLPWSRIVVSLADERWVPLDHEDSNEALVRTHLLRGSAAAARFIGLYRAGVSQADAIGPTVPALLTVPRPYDLVLLGMGGDGHTASLFPEAPELPLALDLARAPAVIQITPPAYAPHARVSLNLSALLDSRERLLHFTGDDKWQQFVQAMGNGPETDLPVRAVLRHPPVEVYWSP